MQINVLHEPYVLEIKEPKESIASEGYHLTQTLVYARMVRGLLKVGQSPKFLHGTFWQKPGDQVTESYLQSRLHMMGGFYAPMGHNSRMSEWFTVPEGMTQEQLISVIESLYQDAIKLDKRCVW